MHARMLAAYNRLMATRWGYTILGRVIPATLFVLIFVAKANFLLGLLVEGTGGRAGFDVITYYAIMIYHVLVLAFLGTVCTLFVIRQPIVRGLTSIWRALVAVAGTFISTPLAFASITISHPAVVFAAVSIMAAGMALSLLSLIHLGRCFGISPQARGLVTSGPYRALRHPLYVSETITTLGVLLPVLSPVTVVIFVAYCLLQFSRAVSEETVLEAAFPKYVAYKKSVARFIPHVY